ncbi:MAG: 1,4-dihydroxy-2-naphthoate polyprenyltransferase [Acidobacteriota bacterium]
MSEKTRVHPWLLAARPRTLTASVAPVLVGTALARGLGQEAVAWPLAVLALASATFIQIGTNLVNDAADFERGADTHDRRGPIRATQTGLLTPRQVKLGAAGAFAFAALLGIPLLYAGGTPILVIGVLSIIAGCAYTTGPMPLAYVGLGEIFVLLFFGLAAVKGTAYVVAGQAFTPWAELAALQVGLQSATLLAINNLRDAAGDARAGKRTLAVRFGPRFGRWEIAALVVGPFAGGAGWWAAERALASWLPLLCLPLAWTLLRRVWSEEPGTRSNQHLAMSARLQLVFASLLAAGLVL